MSSQQPRTPGSRRRIAGERRPPRPDGVPPEPDGESLPGEPGLPPEPEAAQGPPAPATGAPVGTSTRTGASSSASSASGPSRQGAGGPSWAAVAGVGAVALVLVVVAAVLGLGVWRYSDARDADQVDEATRAAPAAAERAAATILSYDYTSLSADAKAAERYMTPSYEKKYAKTFASVVEPNAGKLKARVTADVKASGVSHADPDRVTVLVYVDQTTRSTANGGEAQVAQNRVMLTMQRSGDDWLVDDVTSY